MKEPTTTQQMRGRPVTHEEAAASAQRLINSHFHNPDSARMQIPVSAADDDVVVSDYIREQRDRIEPHVQFMLTGGPVVMASDYEGMKTRAEAAEAKLVELEGGR